jgi:predicted metal-dependent phosphoesterase TrpH
MNAENRVLIEKPDIDLLKRNYTVVDLHFHTAYTDGQNSIPEIVQRASQLGIGIAITDHNDIRGAIEINRYKDILSIPGIEITSREGTHVLVYFYEIKSLRQFYLSDLRPFLGSEIMSSTSLKVEEIIIRARNYNSIVIFPHPYCAAFTGVCNTNFSKDQQMHLFGMVDGVEAVNAENLKRWNLKSTVLGFNLNKAITGGSDGHSIEHMGRSVVYSDCKPTRKNVLDAIKDKSCKVMGKEIHMLGKVASNSMKLRTNIRNYPDIINKNIRYGYNLINNKSKGLRDSMAHHFSERRFKKR